MVLTGNAKGSKKQVYELELTIPQNQGKLEKKGWKGTCNCDNGSKKNVCSHQVALILEWDDQRKLQEGTITKSEKETYKNATTVVKTLTEKQQKKYKKLKTELNGCVVDSLKKMLKLNDQLTTGKKSDLIERVAECKIVGSVPRCPECGGGRPKFKSGLYFCPGFMDDVKFQKCFWVSRDLQRADWKNEEEEDS